MCNGIQQYLEAERNVKVAVMSLDGKLRSDIANQISITPMLAWLKSPKRT